MNMSIQSHVASHWGYRQTCCKCERSFRAVRTNQIVCNCCAPVIANRPTIVRDDGGNDDGSDES